MAEVVYTTEGKGRKNRIVLITMGILIALILTVGLTLAYLTALTETASNVFTSGNIEAELTETAWDEVEAPYTSPGKEIAEKMMPGVIAPKNPVITNTSTIAESEYVGIMLAFEKAGSISGEGEITWTPMTDAEVSALLEGVGINGAGNSAGINVHSNWTRIDVSEEAGKMVFQFNTTIAQDAFTDPLFTQVGIIEDAKDGPWDGDVDNVDKTNFMSWLYHDDGCKGHFQIIVSGAAVQATGVTNEEAKDTILGLFGY